MDLIFGGAALRRLLRLGLFLASALSFLSAQTQIMPISQIKAGQKGKGRTVFSENAIEEFDADILGVIKNYQPKRDVIIARLKGRNLETTGVIAGMSGSPVYIDGKLIGAVAFSFPYAKEPIAGITPISDMLAISKAPAKASLPSAFAIPFKTKLTLEELFEIQSGVFPARDGPSSSGQAFLPLPIPLVFGGFSSKVIDRAAPFFSRLGFRPVKSGGRSQLSENPTLPDLNLRPGDPVTLQLVSGDLDVSAVGTVTHVEGKNVFAFGHPLYNLGAVDYAMARATILTVVPALDNSFKLSVTGDTIGTFTQDRSSGALGEIGRMPRLVPLNIRIIDDGGELREFKLKIVKDKILTALLGNLALQNLLQSEERSVGDLALAFEGDVYLESGQSVHLEDLFSGNFDVAIQDLSGLLTAVVFLLTNNEFQDIAIHRIDLSIKSTEETKIAAMERVWLDKYESSPGEPIAIKVAYRAIRGETRVEEVGLATPNLPLGSEYQLYVGDADAMRQVEMGQYRTTGMMPRSLNQLLRLLGNLRKNNRIYFKIVAPKPGLFLRGEEMPNLPPAMKSLFTSPRAASAAPTELTISTLSEYQLPIPYMFRGITTIPLKIRK